MSKLLLLDAMIVIELFKNGQWQAIAKKYHIYMPNSLVDEINHFKDSTGAMFQIDFHSMAGIDYQLIPGLAAGRVEKAMEFAQKSLGQIVHKEMEAILIVKDDNSLAFCTADTPAIYTLGAFNLSDRGVSFEEIMSDAGLTQSKFPRIGIWTKNDFKRKLEEGALNFVPFYKEIENL